MITLDAITLPFDMIFDNEFDCNKISQSIDYGLDGALIIQEGSKIKGRIIRLSGVNDDGAWMLKSVLDALKLKADTPDLTMVLTFHGTVYNVMFLREGGSGPIEYHQLYKVSDPDSTHKYIVTLKFIEV